MILILVKIPWSFNPVCCFQNELPYTRRIGIGRGASCTTLRCSTYGPAAGSRKPVLETSPWGGGERLIDRGLYGLGGLAHV